MSYLIDTNVISEVKSREPEARVLGWLSSVPLSRSYLSVVTIGEIQKGISSLGAGRRCDELTRWLEEELLEGLGGRVLVVDAAVMRVWGDLTSRLEASGEVMGLMDSLIAATAVYHGLTVATRNEEDFRHVPVNVLNPWRLE